MRYRNLMMCTVALIIGTAALHSYGWECQNNPTAVSVTIQWTDYSPGGFCGVCGWGQEHHWYINWNSSIYSTCSGSVTRSGSGVGGGWSTGVHYSPSKSEYFGTYCLNNLPFCSRCDHTPNYCSASSFKAAQCCV